MLSTQRERYAECSARNAGHPGPCEAQISPQQIIRIYTRRFGIAPCGEGNGGDSGPESINKVTANKHDGPKKG